jgi:hypothetical protein
MGPAPVTISVRGRQARERLPFRVVPRLGEDACWLEQHTQDAQCWIDPNSEFGFDTKSLSAIPVTLLDAAFGVAAVAAHVPFAHGAGGTRNGVGPTHNAHHPITRPDVNAGRRLLNATQRLVPKHQPALPRWCKSIFACDDFAVGPAHAKRQRANQNTSI